jgi:hypothetical protein
MESETAVRLRELEVRIKELELASALATMGLKSGATGVGLVFISVLAILGAALYAYITTGSGVVSGTQMIWREPLMTGGHIVWLTLILVAGLVLYFAFVFKRDAQIVANLGKGELSAAATGATHH